VNSGSAPAGILVRHSPDERFAPRHRSLACPGAWAAIEGARTTESQPDARQPRFLV
jgi:hypothetical protein